MNGGLFGMIPEYGVSARRTQCRWVWLLGCIFTFAAVGWSVLIQFRDSRQGKAHKGSTSELQRQAYRSRRHYTGDPASYEFTLQPPASLCPDTMAAERMSTGDTFVVAVHSAPHHFRFRSTIRDTWARDARFPLDNGRRAVVVFVMGKPAASPKSYETQVKIASEAAVHKDIVQGTFIGSYTSVPRLNILMLKWASLSCPQASYLVKVSDDSFVNMKHMRDTFRDVAFRSSVIYAHVYRKMSVWNGHRLKVVKDTICVSCGYAVSMDLVPRLFNESVGGSLTSMEGLFWRASRDPSFPVSVVNMREFSSLRGGAGTGCDIRSAITSHQLEAQDMLAIWRNLHNASKSCNESRPAFSLF
ncbi:unnamed protein product [Ixodes hexagonus]